MLENRSQLQTVRALSRGLPGMPAMAGHGGRLHVMAVPGPSPAPPHGTFHGTTTSTMDSDSETEHAPVVDKVKEKSHRPPNSAFRQQRLKAWQPILTPRTVLPLFFTVAAVFALFGGLLIYASNQVQEIMLEYTTCGEDAPTGAFAAMPTDLYEYHFKGDAEPNSKPQWKRSENGEHCNLQFEVAADMDGPIYYFYRLTNFYQNHRRYVLSFNEEQIEGKAVSYDHLKSEDDCKPLFGENDKPYYPCGLIANSMFNDTFTHELTGVNGTSTVPMTNKDIAWAMEKSRFKKTKYKASDVVPPPNWQKRYPDGYTDENLPDISEWGEFQNWMRTAGLPTFAKLALRNDSAQLVKNGVYETQIDLNFNTTIYDGKKFILISTRSAIGGRNVFLGVAYCVVAGIAATLGVAFLTQHLLKPRRLGDHSYLSWNQ